MMSFCHLQIDEEATRHEAKAGALTALRKIQLGIGLQQQGMAELQGVVRTTVLFELPSMLRQVFKKARGEKKWAKQLRKQVENKTMQSWKCTMK